MAHYRSVGYGYDINYVARFRLRARRESGVDDFFTIFLRVLPNFEHGWWYRPAQSNAKGHQDMRYPILVLLTTLVVTSLGIARVPELTDQEKPRIDELYSLGIVRKSNEARFMESFKMEMKSS